MAELIQENLVIMTKEFVRGEIKNMINACKGVHFGKYNKNFHVFTSSLIALINDVIQDDVTDNFYPYFERLVELNNKYSVGEATGFIQFTEREILAYVGDFDFN
jgi:hypothetical protein